MCHLYSIDKKEFCLDTSIEMFQIDQESMDVGLRLIVDYCYLLCGNVHRVVLRKSTDSSKFE